MKRIVFIPILAVVLSSAFGFQVNLDPSHIDVTMKSEGVERRTLTLSNSGKEPLQVKVYLNDWTFEKNAKTFLPAGSTDYTLKNNAKIFPTSFSINPLESKRVILSLTAKKDDPIGQYGVVFFEVQPAARSKNSGLSIGGRLGTLIAKETEGKQKRQLQLARSTVKLKGKKLSIDLEGKNPTALLIRPKVTVVLTNENNEVLYKSDLPSDWILMPKVTKSYSGVLFVDKVDAKNGLMALITIDLGDDELMLKESKVIFE